MRLSLILVGLGITPAALQVGISRAPIDHPHEAKTLARSARAPATASPIATRSELSFDDEDFARGLDPSLDSDVRASVRGERTELEIHTPPEWGRPQVRRLRVARDASIASADAVRVRVIAEVPGSAIVLVDEYPSANGECAGRHEAFLRVVSVAGVAAKETHKRKIVSCKRGVALDARAPFTWDARAATLRVRWNDEESGAEHALRIRGDGSVAISPG